ncbi:UNVERIFIED_CONTAM: hypothetical protein Sradi_6664500, partial [Sesamum radiatum]
MMDAACRWIFDLECCGSKNLFQVPRGVEIKVVPKLNFHTTNNEAEYEALTIGLKTTLDARVKQLDVYSDLQLVAMQINSSYETREWSMTQYLKK